MENTTLLTNPNCTSCRDSSQPKELYLNQGKPYGSNIFNIPDSFSKQANSLEAINFYGFSLAEFGRFVYKSNNTSYQSQKMAFPNLDSVYLVNKDKKWMLGVS